MLLIFNHLIILAFCIHINFAHKLRRVMHIVLYFYQSFTYANTIYIILIHQPYGIFESQRIKVLFHR